ncbi:MAG: hypothetical protein ABEH88_10560 [Halobacteriales archaeon]
MKPLLVTDPAIPLRFLLGVVAGVLATLFMDIVMARLPEGDAPPFVASGVLTATPPRSAPGRLAGTVHYLAGWLTGPLFVWLLFATEAIAGGPSILTTLLAAAVLYLLMVGFFVAVVLPRSRAPPSRVDLIRRDWALSAAAYLLVLVPLVALGSRLL